MYNFIDVNEVSEAVILPSEALMLNGDYIENLIPGYRTLQVTGREALSAELTTYETGSRDGSVLSGKRYPARYITVKYQLLADSPEAFRAAYNQLAAVLNVEEAELIFNDEPDKFFIGTPEEVGEAPGGTNSATNEFVLFCADPFKYSVTEYEAEPTLTDNSFLIDYNGTYKAYPTLEAEFFNENEADAALTGSGDCGYVAFFNEQEKIIQLGDPDEADTESYAKSQTLVSQNFYKETDWNNVAQTNWATNNGVISSGQQSGNMAIAVASHAITIAPSTSGTLLQKTSFAARPYINYKVTAQTSGRAADRIVVKGSVIASLVGTTQATTQATGTANIAAGAKVTLSSTKLYASSTATSHAATKSGTYYLWDSSVKNGRIRITNTASNAGKSGQVVGWVNVSDIGVASSGGSSGTSSAASNVKLDKGYGLRAGIQFNGGDWTYVTLKSTTVKWSGTGNHTVTFTVTVKGIEADTTAIEDIKFKVERTDEQSEDRNMNTGILDEVPCKDLEISTYTAPVPNSWYLMPETYGTGSGWHGASITRTIPADAAGDVGAANFRLTYRQKLAIGNNSFAQQELGVFQALVISGNKILAGANVFKSKTGKKAYLRFYVNGKIKETIEIDLSYNNKYFGNDNNKVTAVKTSAIAKTGNKVQFNIGGIVKTYYDNSIKDTKATKVTFYMAQYGTKPPLSYNGLYWAKFVKNNCDTWEDIPNKFSANDVVTADCKSGEVFLNDTLTPSLGALGNDWEDFFLTPGLNQIGFAYSDWVQAGYEPKFKIRYREVFI